MIPKCVIILLRDSVPYPKVSMPKTIFISYSTKDAEGAQEVCRLLEARGISCWIAPRDVPPGADWAESIMDGIKDAIGFVLVLSEHANTSRHCKSEVEVAFSAGKAVFPIRLRQIQPSASLHLFLSSSQWIDAWEPPLENHIERLAGAIKRLQGEPVPDTPIASPAVSSKPAASKGAVAKDIAAKTATAVAPAARSAMSWATARKNRRYVIAAVALMLVFVAWTMFGGGGGASVPGKASKAADRKAGDVQTFDGIEFVWIPAGKFQMGSPTGEYGKGRDEQQHEVILTKGFWMGKYEIKKEQWAAAMDTKPWQGKDGIPYAENGPASVMTWVEANLFARKLNKEQDGPYRLPTEAEWEYACRAGTTTPYSFGAHEGFQLQEHGWFNVNTGGVKENYAHAVGTKKPNPWGLHDMHGNVWEFCSDWYGAYPFPDDGPVTDPKGPETSNSRIIRGGAYDSRDFQLRSAQRLTIYTNRPYASTGIRLVRDEAPAAK